MNTELAKRRTLGERIGAAYTASPKVGAVILAGSVGRGNADVFSDIEIDVFWNEEPSDEERLAPITALGLTTLYIAADENEWADGFMIEGIKCDTSQFRVATIERWLHDVVEHADTDVEKQLIIAAIQHGEALHGEELIERWRTRAAAYPNALVHAMVGQYLTFRQRLILEMLAERGDELLLRFSLVDEAQRVMGVLMGLNRLYIAHPYYKWLDWQTAQMRIAPANLAARLRAAVSEPADDAVAVLHALEDEIFTLVNENLPDFDTREPRAEFDARRVAV